MSEPMIGKVYGIPPQPPVEETHALFPAGAVTLRRGVPRPRPRVARARPTRTTRSTSPSCEERSPEGGFTDEGVTIHVFDADDGHEYLRFDVFDDEPHYHYIHRTDDGRRVVNNVIDFDVTAHGDMLPWVLAHTAHAPAGDAPRRRR